MTEAWPCDVILSCRWRFVLWLNPPRHTLRHWNNSCHIPALTGRELVHGKDISFSLQGPEHSLTLTIFSWWELWRAEKWWSVTIVFNHLLPSISWLSSWSFAIEPKQNFTVIIRIFLFVWLNWCHSSVPITYSCYWKSDTAHEVLSWADTVWVQHDFSTELVAL